MDNAPSSPGHTLRALRLHVPRRDGQSSPSSGDSDSSDDDRVLRPQSQQQQQQERVDQAPPPQPHNMSLRWILEQRNLLVSRVASSSSYAADAGGISTISSIDGAAHSPLSAHAIASDGFAFPRVQEQGVGRHDADVGYGAHNQHYRRYYEEPYASPQQHQSFLSRSQTEQATRSPPSAPRSQASSITETASIGFGHTRRRTMTPEERRIARTCTVEGCSNYIVDRHRCFRHGGGKRCSIDGCTSSAKQLGLCWRHGGSLLCKVDGCIRGVKVKGLCWGHSGGKKNKKQVTPSQVLVVPAQPGPRCLFDGCRNAPILNSFCEAHCREVAQPGYVFEL